MKIISFSAILLIFVFFTVINFANEVEIFADSIDYDTNGNIVAKGNVKIIDGDEILTSRLLLLNKMKI